MNRKREIIIKIIAMISIMFAICISIMPNVFAFAPDEVTAPSSVTGQDEISNLGSMLVGIIQTAGVVVAVVILLVLGIKYMMGSPEDKSEYKKSMMPYLIGALVLFGASTIANVVYQFASNI